MSAIRDLTESVADTVLENVGRAMARAQERRPLNTDVLETDDAIRVVFDAPGADAEDVQVRFEDGAVHVRIDRFREYREGYSMLFPGRGLTLSGRATLPREVHLEPEAATATLHENGTLHVTIPKTAGEPAGARTDEGSEPDEPTGGP
jgi:HSP20 family protein